MEWHHIWMKHWSWWIDMMVLEWKFNVESNGRDNKGADTLARHLIAQFHCDKLGLYCHLMNQLDVLVTSALAIWKWQQSLIDDPSTLWFWFCILIKHQYQLKTMIIHVNSMLRLLQIDFNLVWKGDNNDIWQANA